jgi:hypothetical protein
MNLLEAYNLLVEDGIADNQRYFGELYKHFQFKDTDRLKDYLDFILQEPVQWIHGFPTKLTTKTSFSKPKTAVIKLLKKESVHRDVGRPFSEKVHEVIWKTYKQEWENVLKLRERIRPIRISVNERFDAESIDEQPLPVLKSMGSSIQGEELEEIVMEDEIIEKESEIHDQNQNQNKDQNIDEIPALHIKEIPQLTTSDKERIEILKEVILKLSSSLEPSVFDAFRLLLSRV